MMRQIRSPVYGYGYSLLHPASFYDQLPVSRPCPVPVYPGRLFRPGSPPPGFHTRPLYPKIGGVPHNNGGLRDAEADQLLTCLLSDMYGFDQPEYYVLKEYDCQAYEKLPNDGGLQFIGTEHEHLLGSSLLQQSGGFEELKNYVRKGHERAAAAHERSVAELMDFDAVMTNKLKGIRTATEKVPERKEYDHEAYERSVGELMDFDAVMTNKLKGIRTEWRLVEEREEYDHEAYERSVAELMDFDAEMTNKLKEIRTERRLVEERVPEPKEEDAATMTNMLHKISSVAPAKPAEEKIPEKKDEEMCDEYAREMDVIIEKVIKKESSKRCLCRSSKRQRIDHSSVVH